MSCPATLLEKLIETMDAADEATNTDRSVEIQLDKGCLIVTAYDLAGGWGVGEDPRSVERRMSLDMVDCSLLLEVGRDLVEQAIMAL